MAIEGEDCDLHVGVGDVVCRQLDVQNTCSNEPRQTLHFTSTAQDKAERSAPLFTALRRPQHGTT